jgi:hypothetical protein
MIANATECRASQRRLRPAASASSCQPLHPESTAISRAIAASAAMLALEPTNSRKSVGACG